MSNTNNNFSKYRINKSNHNVNNSETVSCLACNPKGEKPNIIVGFDNGMITLFNFDVKGNFTFIDTVYGHTSNVLFILFNPINSLIFVSYSSNGKLILWNFMNSDIKYITKIVRIDKSIIFNYDGSILCFRDEEFLSLYKIKINYPKRNNQNKSIKVLFDESNKIMCETSELGNSDNYSLFFHPNKNILFIGFNDPKSIVVCSVNDLSNELTAFSKIDSNIINKNICSSCLNITGTILFLVNEDILCIIDISEDCTLFEKRKEYDLKKYFINPTIMLLFHPKNPEILMLYDLFNIIILKITLSKITCLYEYRHPTEITSCSFNFSGNSIIFSSENKLVILELKLNIVNNNRLNKKTNMMRMLGNIKVSAS